MSAVLFVEAPPVRYQVRAATEAEPDKNLRNHSLFLDEEETADNFLFLLIMQHLRLFKVCVVWTAVVSTAESMTF